MIRDQFSYFLTISGEKADVEMVVSILRLHTVNKYFPLNVLAPGDIELDSKAGTATVSYELKDSFGGTIEDDTYNIVSELEQIAKSVPGAQFALDANDEDDGTKSIRYRWVNGEKTESFVRTLEPDEMDRVTLDSVKEKLGETGDVLGIKVVSAMDGGAELERDSKVLALLDSMWEMLPHEPAKIWTKSKGDDEILCEKERTAEGIADLIDALYGGQTASTGYYDPKEDERNGETDERTGFYYVTIN